jgi:1-acyl-sn-glycerol-3-phosphate acyltransferase
MIVNAVWMALLVPLAIVLMLLSWNTAVGSWMARRLWAPFLVRITGSRIIIHGSENVDSRQPTIYVCNHQSAIDIPVLFIALPVNFRFVAKSQLRWVPILGWYMWAAGHIFIDRGHGRRAFQALERAARQIRNGKSIVVYPEGTRSPDGRIQPFKKGSFALALKAGVRMCPVTIEGSHGVMPKNSWIITPGEIHVKIGKPIDPRLFGDDRDRLLQTVRQVIVAQDLELGGKGGPPQEIGNAA